MKAQSQKICHLLALVEQQQEAIKKLPSPCSPPREPKASTSCSESQLDVIWEEIFNLILGTVNIRQGTAVVSHNTTIVTPVINKASFQDKLAEEANYTPSCQPRHVKFGDMIEGGLTFTPHNFPEEVVLPPRPMLQSHPDEIGLHAAAHEFRKKNEGTKD